MAVLRNRSQKGFTIVDNFSLMDTRLSLKAIGLLVKMLSLPDRWDFSEAGIIAVVKDGQSSVRSGLKELEDAGYLVRRRIKDASGKFTDCEWEIMACPCCNPQLDFPNMDTPNMDTTDNITTKESTTKEEISSSPGTGGRGGGIAYDEWREAYERLCPSLPKMRVLSDKRRAAVRSMIKQGLGIDDFREACRMAEGSEFLKGGGGTGWKADADWMFNANNVVKVLEGRYDTIRDDRPHGTEPVVEKWKPAPDPIEELRKFEAANPDLVREMERMGY